MSEPHHSVSVAIASYNGVRFIGEQLESILHQTLLPLEIIIVDDGSVDGTLEVIKKIQEQHQIIKLYLNDKNTGVTKTFEKAVSLCKGEFIALSDQDDLWVPHKLETLVNAISTYDAVYSNSMLVDEKGTSLNKKFSSLMNLKTYNNGAPFLLSNTVPGHSILLKKEFLEKILPFPEQLYFDLWIAFNAASNNGIKYVDEVLVHYRQHSSNVVGTRLSSNKKNKLTAQEEFERKKRELQILATAPIKDVYTKSILNEMLRLFHRKISFRRSAFFFRHFNQILSSKQKPQYRKVMFCFKMLFKPNY